MSANLAQGLLRGLAVLAPCVALAACGDSAQAPVAAASQARFALAVVQPSADFRQSCLLVRSRMGAPVSMDITVEEFAAWLFPKLTWERQSEQSFILRQEYFDSVARTQNSVSYLLTRVQPGELSSADSYSIAPSCGKTGVVLSRVVKDGVEFSVSEIAYLATAAAQQTSLRAARDGAAAAAGPAPRANDAAAPPTSSSATGEPPPQDGQPPDA